MPLSDRILLNKAVDTIDWDPSCDTAEGEKKIEITCTDGTLYVADFVIITSSLGFLKSNFDSLFVPSLPPFKKRAIQVRPVRPPFRTSAKFHDISLRVLALEQLTKFL